jgi:Amt family ammonium transporter
VASVGAFVAATTGALFLALKYTIGLRVSEEEELAGLDVLEHGSAGYGQEIHSPLPAPSGSSTEVRAPTRTLAPSVGD